MLKAFFDADALGAWWQVRALGDDAAAAGAYAIEWPPTDFRDEILGRLGGVFRGTIVQFQAGQGFFVADAFWLPPDGEPIGPMALEVRLKAEPAGATRVRVMQTGFEESAALAALLRSDRRRLGARADVAEVAARALNVRPPQRRRAVPPCWRSACSSAAALLATYPLVRHPARTIAGGLGDPIILTTVLAWDADRMLHGLRGLWDPPFLFPHRWTLAYSEHMLGVAIFTAPIQWIFGNAVLTYNVAYIGSYALAGFGMFLLTRALWGRADAAVLAGLAFALTPYRLAQSTHLQVLMNGWMPIGLLALHRYFAERLASLAARLRRRVPADRAFERLLPVLLSAPDRRGRRRGAPAAPAAAKAYPRRPLGRGCGDRGGAGADCLRVLPAAAGDALHARSKHAAGPERQACGLLPGRLRGLELGRTAARRRRRASAVSRLRRHPLRGRGCVHGRRPRSRRGIGWQPASHR